MKLGQGSYKNKERLLPIGMIKNWVIITIQREDVLVKEDIVRVFDIKDFPP